jgi:hypothetical protein
MEPWAVTELGQPRQALRDVVHHSINTEWARAYGQGRSRLRHSRCRCDDRWVGRGGRDAQAVVPVVTRQRS